MQNKIYACKEFPKFTLYPVQQGESGKPKSLNGYEVFLGF